eukprot:39777_1
MFFYNLVLELFMLFGSDDVCLFCFCCFLCVFFLVFYAINAVIQITFYHFGIGYVLSALFAVHGSALDSYRYIYFTYFAQNGQPMTCGHPPIKYSPTYFINKLEIKMYSKEALRKVD